VGSRTRARHRRYRARGTACRRVPGQAGRHRRVSHRCLHTFGQGPRGSLSRGARPRGRGGRGRGRRGRPLARGRRSRHPALHPRMQGVQILPLGQDESVRAHPRDSGQGTDARRLQPTLRAGQGAAPLHGHVDVRFVHGRARDRAREGAQRRAPRSHLSARLRSHDRHRRRAAHREGRARLERRGVRARRNRSLGDSGRGARGRGADHRRRHEPSPRPSARPNS